MEHEPRRTCVGCRTTRAKPELARVAATPDGVSVDPDHTLPGRGAYLCPDPRCLDRVERAGGQPLRRALRTEDSITGALAELHRHLDEPQSRHGGATPAAATAPGGPASDRTTTTKE